MTEYSDSTAAINARGDDQAWPNILKGLEDGGRLRLVHKIERAVLEGLPETHPSAKGIRTMTISRTRRLHREGVLVNSGVDQFTLARFALK